MQFYLCTTEGQYELCRQLQQRIDGYIDPLGFPTVYGMSDDGNVIGFTSTNTEQGAIISGPTVIDPDFKPRLKYAQEQIKAHEFVLAKYGVTEYLFSVEKTNEKMLRTVQAAGFTPYDEDDKLYWYKKEVGK